MKHIFIIGSKGIPAKYGGFETFVDKLTENKKNKNIQYHVACLADNNNEYIYNEVRCFNIKVPNIGSGKAIYYDIKALAQCIKYIEEKKIEDAVVYILACRIGPFIGYYKKKLVKLKVQLFVNPDGHEWKRKKWNKAIRLYWKFSERLMVKNADLLICDSKAIEKYIQNDYKSYNPRTTFIAYGGDVTRSTIKEDNNRLKKWYEDKGITFNNYYLIVGRFVSENNYETMIKEFMLSKTKKELVIISNVEKNSFYNELLEKTGFDKDERIKFVGTVYDNELLKKIREKAYGYIHGHEVGGTNPSLLEALSSTRLNLLLDVSFNKEVAEDGAVYFTKETKNLANLIEKCDMLTEENIIILANKATSRIKEFYSWNKIVNDYESLFTKKVDC